MEFLSLMSQRSSGASASPIASPMQMKRATKLKRTKKNDNGHAEDVMDQEGDDFMPATKSAEAHETEWGDDKMFTIHNNKRVILNVGGKRFETYVDTCTKHGRSTMLGAMFLTLDPENIKDEYFIDRDPELFRAVLQWYRTGYFCCPPGVPREIMEKELEFYGIPNTELKKSYTKVFHLSGKKVWSCRQCGTHLALHKSLHSKGYHGKSGDAYLFNDAVNVFHGDLKKKKLMSGQYIIRKAYCVSCNQYIGWKYEEALGEIEENKYKEGRTILELAMMVKERQMTL